MSNSTSIYNSKNQEHPGKMNFKEPKKKKRVHHQFQRPFPIPLNKNDEWVMYTAHLSASGTCIAHPEDMAAIYCMGFFGKGSLSRGFPLFGKRRFGAPPLVRERQWKRRKQWLEDVKTLETESFLFNSENLDKTLEEPSSSTTRNSPKINEKEENKFEELETKNTKKIDEKIENKSPKNEKNKFQEKSKNSEEFEKSKENISEIIDNEKDIDEVVLDSTEDEEVCEIVENDPNTLTIDLESQGDDIFVLNDEIMDKSLESDNYIDLFKLNKEKCEINPNELVVLPDSDSDTENYLKNIKPKIETESFPVVETLQLTFEETFFLMYGLGCLQVVNYEGNFFSIIEAWKHFNEQDKNFLNKYIVYHYFRSKGWVVKPGLKCSGDFVLYKKGPQFYHASYVVFIEVADADSLQRDDVKTVRDCSWNNIHSLNRLAITIGKELLIVQVLWPSTISRNSNPVPLEALSEFTVREILIRRWNPNETCENISLDDEENESEDEDSS